MRWRSHRFCTVTARPTAEEVSTTASGGKAQQLPGVSPFMCSPCGGRTRPSESHCAVLFQGKHM